MPSHDARKTPLSPRSYGVIRLNRMSDRAWAVVENNTGAILVEGQALMMRLTREDAMRIAENATRAARAPDGDDRASPSV